MTPAELQTEWDYRFTERLGIMAEDQEPTGEQIIIAMAEADAAIDILTTK